MFLTKCYKVSSLGYFTQNACGKLSFKNSTLWNPISSCRLGPGCKAKAPKQKGERMKGAEEGESAGTAIEAAPTAGPRGGVGVGVGERPYDG